MDTPEPHSSPDLTDVLAQMQPALAVLTDAARVDENLTSTMRTVAAAVARMQAEVGTLPTFAERVAASMAPVLSEIPTVDENLTSTMRTVAAAVARMQAEVGTLPTFAERMATAMAPALSVSTAAVADLSGVSSALQQIAQTQGLARQPWFAEGVQALYASDVLDRLDEQALTDPVALPSEEAAELGAVALAFQQNPLLTDAQAKRLFQAWVCLLLLVLWAYVSVSVEGPLEESLGSAASIAEVVGAAMALTAPIWKRRNPGTEDGTPGDPESS